MFTANFCHGNRPIRGVIMAHHVHISLILIFNFYQILIYIKVKKFPLYILYSYLSGIDKPVISPSVKCVSCVCRQTTQ